jgi:hypothetical protein
VERDAELDFVIINLVHFWRIYYMNDKDLDQCGSEPFSDDLRFTSFKLNSPILALAKINKCPVPEGTLFVGGGCLLTPDRILLRSIFLLVDIKIKRVSFYYY